MTERRESSWNKFLKSIVLFQSLSIVARRPTHRKAQKLNHDISVDLSATAINYHQMVRWRDIIKSNGTDYFKIFFLALSLLVLFEGGKQWMKFIFLFFGTQIISIFNFHCVNACMHECENWYQYTFNGISLECLFWLQFSMRRLVEDWCEEKYLWRVAVFDISCQTFICSPSLTFHIFSHNCFEIFQIFH